MATGTAQGAMWGALAGAAAGDIGGIKGIDDLTRGLMHGITQGGISKAGGGRFGDGALGAFASSMASPMIGRASTGIGRTMTAAAVGGTAAAIGGGKFANGAITGAFVQAFKDSTTAETEEVQGVKVYRKDIDLGGEDKYGHWWIEIDGNESYGWWPKHGVDYKGTLLGVDGELNGQTSFGGTPTMDPHHGDRSVGVKVFNVHGDSSISKAQYVAHIRTLATSYSGSWSWPLGQNCHSFQIQMLDRAGLAIRPAGK